jgi:hypothetical protein
MRRPRRIRTAAAALTMLSALLASVAVVLAPVVLAASPAPTSAAGGDPRSSGQGPGLVGDPLLAIAIVAVIGIVSRVGTLLWVRATGGRSRS